MASKRRLRLEDLNEDVICHIITKVAGHGVNGLANVRLVSPLLNSISHRKSVYNNVCLDNVPILFPWYPSEGFIEFIRNVRLVENPEIMFRDGAFNLFNGRKAGREKARELFNKAAKAGHMVSRYAITMLQLSEDDKSEMGEGIEFLIELWQKNFLRVCRAKLRMASHLRGSNVPQDSQLGLRSWNICNSRETCKGWTEDRNRWLDEVSNPEEVCINCRLDGETDWFCQFCLMGFTED